MLATTNQIIPFSLGIILGFGVGYAIRAIQQVRQKQKELEKQTITWVHDARDHINCRCSISYPDETLEGGDDDKEVI